MYKLKFNIYDQDSSNVSQKSVKINILCQTLSQACSFTGWQRNQRKNLNALWYYNINKNAFYPFPLSKSISYDFQLAYYLAQGIRN